VASLSDPGIGRDPLAGAGAGSDGLGWMTPAGSVLQNRRGDYRLEAAGFASVTARAPAGPGDAVTLLGSGGGDTFVSRPADGWLSHALKFELRFSGFEQVQARVAGPGSVANLYDGPGSDTYLGAGDVGTLLGDAVEGRSTTVRGFAQVNVHGTGLNVLRLSPVTHGLSAPGFVPPAALVFDAPLPRDWALYWMRQVALQVDPLLATAPNPLILAARLRDHVYRRVVVGANRPQWGALDAYERYLRAVVTREEPLICGGMSIVYADLCAAFGLEARYVGLYAADGFNTHASVEVRIGGRWFVMDPTFNVSFTTPAGLLLSFAEMQQGVPYRVSRNGLDARPQLVLERYPVPLSLLLNRLEYPPLLTY
jgi:hypothetical protein